MRKGRIEVDGRALGVVLENDELVTNGGARHPLAGAKFLPPVIPGNFYAAGLNFRAHIEWANAHHGTTYKVPEQADIGYRSGNALIGSGTDIVIPEDSAGPVEFEGELVAVIGRKTKNVSEKRALDAVAGGMIFSVAQYISRMSRYVTLHPGDVIWLGCDGPTVPALQPGDLVEVVNDAIGVLANRVRKVLAPQQ
jgi:2-keto-4-pentenoate hydratase/2-oxohepta-3-ene-1,7-dioic acid hydratase in catechol pathway